MIPPVWSFFSEFRAFLMRLVPRRRSLRWSILACLALALGLASSLFVARVRTLRELRAIGPGWSFPSRLYTADFPLVAGGEVSDDVVLRQLAARAYRRVARSPVAPGQFAQAGGALEIGLRGFDAAPDPAGHGGPERVRVTWAPGHIAAVERLGGFTGFAAPDLAHAPRLEPVAFAVLVDSLRVRRTWVPLARIPRVLQAAVIASEDRRFRRHMGLDLKGNARAIFVNVRAGGVRQGASTLTQQLARGLFLGHQRTLPRKLEEAVIAVGLELALSKDEILEMYLNSVYWGQDGADGIAGIVEASRHYFGVPPDSLRLAQAALLAGIIPGPNALSPLRNPRLATRARHRVLMDLVEVGAVDSAAAGAADRSPLALHHVPPPPDRFPAAAAFLRDELSRRLQAGAAEHRGLAVLTTIDPVWQADAESLVVEGLDALEPSNPRDFLEGAFVAMSPASGAVRAMVGGRDMQAFGFNRATQALRQPGSAIKPVVYAAALDPTRGAPALTPASTVPDLHRSFDTPEGPWTPRNDQEDYHEQVTLAKGLAKSLNLATANLVQLIGPGTVARYCERFGLGRPKPVASIGLGSNEVTPLALTSAYTVFANQGLRAEPTAVRAVADPQGRDPMPRLAAPARVLPAETAMLMTGLLEDVVTFGVAYPLRKSYGFARPVAGKTGTTNDYLDGWFVGFTPQVVAGVWVGHDQPRPLAGPAAETALRVWARVMNRLMDGVPRAEFASDRGLELVWIDPYTGGLARGDCPSPMRVPFLPGSAPTVACKRDHTADWARIHAAMAADSTARDSLLKEGLLQYVDSTAVVP